jgi:hypothetical protein
MTLSEFVKKYDGKQVDFDGVFGSQCFTKEHCVLMADYTYKPIADIKIGDKVIGYDNNVNTVTQLFKSEKPVVHIRTTTNDFIVTADHPFYFQNGKFLEATELCKQKPALFDKINYCESGLTDNELKFLGFWLGDGNIGKQKNENKTDEIRVTYGMKKVPFVNSLNILSTYRKHHECENAYVGNIKKTEHNKLTEIILNYCAGEYKKLPLIFTNREYELILEGIINADGYKKRNTFVISNTSLSLLLSLQAICILLGFDTKTLRLTKRTDKKIFINGKEVKSIKPIYRLTINKKSLRPVKYSGKILEEKIETVYNLETDGTHTYICNNHKVHNCVDLFRQYVKDVLNIPEHTGACSSSGGAKDLFLDYHRMPVEKKYFLRSSSKICKAGDVLIWNETLTNKYGHVAICLGMLEGSYIVFEQDGFKQDGAKIRLRGKENLLGYLRKRG